jgi:hypothetical protein
MLVDGVAVVGGAGGHVKMAPSLLPRRCKAVRCAPHCLLAALHATGRWPGRRAGRGEAAEGAGRGGRLGWWREGRGWYLCPRGLSRQPITRPDRCKGFVAASAISAASLMQQHASQASRPPKEQAAPHAQRRCAARVLVGAGVPGRGSRCCCCCARRVLAVERGGPHQEFVGSTVLQVLVGRADKVWTGHSPAPGPRAATAAARAVRRAAHAGGSQASLAPPLGAQSPRECRGWERGRCSALLTLPLARC